jgi:hypothetical protein
MSLELISRFERDPSLFVVVSFYSTEGKKRLTTSGKVTEQVFISRGVSRFELDMKTSLSSASDVGIPFKSRRAKKLFVSIFPSTSKHEP